MSVRSAIEALRENPRLVDFDEATLRGYAACLDDVLAILNGVDPLRPDEMAPHPAEWHDR